MLYSCTLFQYSRVNSSSSFPGISIAIISSRAAPWSMMDTTHLTASVSETSEVVNVWRLYKPDCVFLFRGTQTVRDDL